MSRADRRAGIGRPWWTLRTLRRDQRGRLEVIVSNQGYMNREAKRELRVDALGRNRAGRGIAGYRPNK